MKKELGKIMIDIAKLVIGGAILGGLMRQDIPYIYLLSIGGVASLSLIFIGLFLISLDTKK